jgi:hypothetical protein
MEFDLLASNASTFGYCTDFNGPASLQEPRCLSCLQQLSDDFYMSNCMYLIYLIGIPTSFISH